MKFGKIVEKLQEENKGYVVLVKCGIFFNAIGKDAVILSEILGLNVICFYDEVCKCGIPVKKIKKFMKKMAEKEISFVIYLYDKENIDKPITQIYKYNSKVIEESRKCLECDKCKSKKEKLINSDIEKIIKDIQIE